MSRWRNSDSLSTRALFDVHVFGAERVMRAVLPMMLGLPHKRTESGHEMPLNLPKIFEPAWVAEQLLRFPGARGVEAAPASARRRPGLVASKRPGGAGCMSVDPRT